MLDETDIQKLLRLKRYEQPPAGYHQKFLQDFHRRQRVDMLRQPIWKIALERLGAFFSEHSMGRTAYGAATVAVLLFAGVASFHMLNNSGGSVAGNPAPGLAQYAPEPPSTAPVDHLNLSGHMDYQPASLPQLGTAQNTDPHYIIDSRPVSYERPFSF